VKVFKPIGPKQPVLIYTLGLNKESTLSVKRLPKEIDEDAKHVTAIADEACPILAKIIKDIIQERKAAISRPAL
jgi:hypothetical protein